MKNRDGDSIVVVIVSTILWSIPLNYPNYYTPPHFTNNPHQLHRFVSHSDEIKGSDLKN